MHELSVLGSKTNRDNIGIALLILVPTRAVGKVSMRASGRAVIIDVSSSGASGDKFLGALVDLGGSPKSLGRVADVVERNLPGAIHVQVKTTRVERGEISAQLVEVSSEEKVSK